MIGKASNSPLSEATRTRLDQLRHKLLTLHKLLLDGERTAYERDHGRQTAGGMLQLLINHEQFAWLRRISEIIVRVDEILEDDDPSSPTNAAILMTQARALLMQAENGDEFAQKYNAALQGQPGAVLVHKDVAGILSDG